MATVALIDGKADWRAPDLAGGDWVRVLRAPERDSVRAGTYVLPSLDGLMDGRGVAVVRGIPLDGDCEAIALGVAATVGTPVPQGGAPLVHVRDAGADPSLATTRSYQHSAPLSYHADPTDLVALLCVRPAAVGGLSTVVSSVAVHNEVVRTRPDLAAVLYQPLRHSGPGGSFESPVYRPGRAVHYAPDYIRAAAQALSAAQREALDLLDALHHDPRFVLTMDLRPGDMQILDNRLVVHGRTAFRDDPARPRDLIRVWLST